MSLPLTLNALPLNVQLVPPVFARYSAPGDVAGMTKRLTLATTVLVEPSGPNAVARNQPEFTGSALLESATTVYEKPARGENVFVLGDQFTAQLFTTWVWKFETPTPAER